MEPIIQTRLLDKKYSVPLSFEIMKDSDIVSKIKSSNDVDQNKQKEVEIINLNNQIEDIKQELSRVNLNYTKVIDNNNYYAQQKNNERKYRIGLLIFLSISILLLSYIIMSYLKH